MHRVSLTCGLAVACLAAADAKFEIENGALKTPAVVFKTGSAVLQNADDAAVALAAAYLTEKTSVSTLRIEAHVQHGVKDAQLVPVHQRTVGRAGRSAARRHGYIPFPSTTRSIAPLRQSCGPRPPGSDRLPAPPCSPCRRPSRPAGKPCPSRRRPRRRRGSTSPSNPAP